MTSGHSGGPSRVRSGRRRRRLGRPPSAGSWPPEGAPRRLADPYGKPPAGPGVRGSATGDCPLGHYWDVATQKCVEHEHQSCDGYDPPRTWSWEAGDCVPHPCSGPGIWYDEPHEWSWEEMGCVPVASGGVPAPGRSRRGLAALRRRRR